MPAIAIGGVTFLADCHLGTLGSIILPPVGSGHPLTVGSGHPSTVGSGHPLTVGSGHPLTEGRIFDPRVPHLSRIGIEMTIDIAMPYVKLLAVCYLGTLEARRRTCRK